jgi:UDP-N-acetylmuramoyl-tripeptide--D-alanyl-D-alanine ligase
MVMSRFNIFLEFLALAKVKTVNIDQLKSMGRITQDTRQLKVGDIYIALRGEQHDGHRFASQAAAIGAACLIVEQQLDVDCPQIIVEDVLIFIQDFARYYREKHTATIIGLTGTNGKTTCKEMIYAVLSNRYKTDRTQGNYNNHIGVPLTLVNMPDDAEIVIVEMGSNHQGEIDFLAAMVLPDIALVTSVGYGHMEFFESIEAVAVEKTSLFLHAKKTVLINGLDSHLKDVNVIQNRLVLSFDDTADFKLSVDHLNDQGGVVGAVNTVKLNLRIAGRHHLINAAFAVACGELLGLSTEEIERGINTFQPVSGRMEWVNRGLYTFINDAYNANPTSVKAACEFFTELNDSRKKIIVLGDMLELGHTSATQHQQIVDDLKNSALTVYLIGKVYAKTQTELQKAQSTSEVAMAIKTEFKEAIILLKGSRGMKLEDILTFFEDERTGAC